MFQFELIITESCNLDCKYCYMTNRAQRMTQGVFEAHYEALPPIMEMYNEKRFATTLFGGEPLLNWPLIEYILPIVSSDPKCDQIVLTTNGILLNDTNVKFLQEHNVNISLSFDGLWQENPKFDLLAKIRKVLDVNACKAMVSPAHMWKHTLVENYEYFLKAGIPNPDFSLVRDDIWGHKDITEFQFQLLWLAKRVIKYNNEGIETLPGIFSLYILDTLAGRKFGKRSFGCFAGCGGGGFMPDGVVYPCARFGSEKRDWIYNSLTKKFNKYSLAKYNYDVINPQFYPRCQSCPLYVYCNAGCTYSQMKETHFEPLGSVCELLNACYEMAFYIVDELKDCETFQRMIKNMTGDLI